MGYFCPPGSGSAFCRSGSNTQINADPFGSGSETLMSTLTFFMYLVPYILNGTLPVPIPAYFPYVRFYFRALFRI
jgi:hypothetical protein